MIVGTWNIENLFRPGTEGGPSSAGAYDAKLSALAGVIDALAPDVLGVQEVGDPAALDDLVDRLEGTWHVATSDFPDERGIRVGFVSRAPLTAIEQVHAFPDGLEAIQVDDSGTPLRTMGRGALKARVTVDGHAVDLVTCHLKSKLLTFPGGRFSPRGEDERARFGAYALYRRAAEATTLRAYANALLDGAGRDRAVVVLGDLNDEAGAATTQILVGPPGSEIGTAGFAAPDKGDGARLWNLAPLLPEARRYSRIYRGRRELIDHVLVSHALVTRVEAVDSGPGDAPSIDDDPAERRDAPGSDHLPITARFVLG